VSCSVAEHDAALYVTQQYQREWVRDVAVAEHAHATTSAKIDARRLRQLGGAERTFATNSADAAHERDLAFAAAEADYWLDEAAADNVQRQAGAAARADYLSAHYDARVVALADLDEDLGGIPWAHFEQARADAERDAWADGGSGSLRNQYLAWQQSVGAAHTAYAGTRAGEYLASAAVTAAAVRNHARTLALATELTRVWREARHGHAENSDEANAANADYRADYAEADRDRREA
jgi:hypothetical protein